VVYQEKRYVAHKLLAELLTKLVASIGLLPN